MTEATLSPDPTAPRSVFSTSTGKSATLATIAGLVIAIAPFTFSIVKRRATEPFKADIADIEQMVMTLAGLTAAGGGMGAIAGRARATDKVFSPQWMPGHNKDDLNQAIASSSETEP